MVWARIDDEILDNEKISNVGALGFALHVAGITWSCRNLSDGFLPRAKVRTLLDFEDVYFARSDSEASAESGPVDALEVAESLVEAGLWIEDRERRGFWIHDFLDYNPPKAKVLADRERGRKRAKESAHKRRASEPPEDQSEAPASPEASAEATAKLRSIFAPTSHGPVPVPVPRSEPHPPASARQVQGQRLLRPDEPLTDQRRKDFASLTEQTAPRPIEADWSNFVDDRIGRSMLFGGEGAIDADWRKWVRRENGYATTRRVSEQQRRGTGGGPRGDRQGLDGWKPPKRTGTDDNPFGDDS